jgi:hypothetical protein
VTLPLVLHSTPTNSAQLGAGLFGGKHEVAPAIAAYGSHERRAAPAHAWQTCSTLSMTDMQERRASLAHAWQTGSTLSTTIGRLAACMRPTSMQGSRGAQQPATNARRQRHPRGGDHALHTLFRPIHVGWHTGMQDGGLATGGTVKVALRLPGERNMAPLLLSGNLDVHLKVHTGMLADEGKKA